MYNIRTIAPTIASLLGIPSFTEAAPIPEVLAKTGGRADRVLMYNPDAVAWWVFEKYRDIFVPALQDSLVLKMESVMPSVTPVCFASIYSGLMPESHGIRSYTKPVLTCDTVFDALIRAGKKPAICSTGTDSISMIFRKRRMDYFIFDTHDEVNDKAEELIRKNEHDLIVVYNGNYDSTMHKNGPEAPVSLDALRHNTASYLRLTAAAEEAWGRSGLKYASAFVTDHGCHEIDGQCGSHGLDMPEDMNVVHLWKSN